MNLFSNLNMTEKDVNAFLMLENKEQILTGLRKFLDFCTLPFDDYVFDRDEISSVFKDKFPIGDVLYCLMKKEDKYYPELDWSTYFLYPTYIGQSKNVFNRLKTHRGPKQFDLVCMQVVDEEDKLAIERYMIAKVQPCENILRSKVKFSDLKIAEKYGQLNKY